MIGNFSRYPMGLKYLRLCKFGDIITVITENGNHDVSVIWNDDMSKAYLFHDQSGEELHDYLGVDKGSFLGWKFKY